MLPSGEMISPTLYFDEEHSLDVFAEEVGPVRAVHDPIVLEHRPASEGALSGGQGTVAPDALRVELLVVAQEAFGRAAERALAPLSHGPYSHGTSA